MFRVATFNLENLDDGPDADPPLGERLAVLRPQLLRLRADVLCLQEVNAQKVAGQRVRSLAALDALLAGTPLAEFHRAATLGPSGSGPADAHNLVVLSRFPIVATAQHLHDLVPAPSHRMTTAEPPGDSPAPVRWDRPALACELALPEGRVLHVINVHFKAPLAANVPGQKLAPFVWRSVPGWAEGMFLASVKRAGQAFETRLVVDRLFDREPEALVAVCGDVNADEGELPVRMLIADEMETGNGALAPRALVALERSVPESQRFTVVHHGRRQMLDHVLVSRALMGWLRSVEIHNEDLGDEFAMHLGVRHAPESLHAPVVATFADPSRTEGEAAP
ncbi:MAG: endonuclease/exonuclease/phosphatase family protein [Alphaproteobacteria bacterium]